MEASSNAAGNSTLPEVEDSMNPLHVVAVVGKSLNRKERQRLLSKFITEALAQQRQTASGACRNFNFNFWVVYTSTSHRNGPKTRI